MNCPECKTWTFVLQTRQRKTDGAKTRRYECANGHRFSTTEQITNPPPKTVGLVRDKSKASPTTRPPLIATQGATCAN